MSALQFTVVRMTNLLPTSALKLSTMSEYLSQSKFGGKWRMSEWCFIFNFSLLQTRLLSILISVPGLFWPCTAGCSQPFGCLFKVNEVKEETELMLEQTIRRVPNCCSWFLFGGGRYWLKWVCSPVQILEALGSNNSNFIPKNIPSFPLSPTLLCNVTSSLQNALNLKIIYKLYNKFIYYSFSNRCSFSKLLRFRCNYRHLSVLFIMETLCKASDKPDSTFTPTTWFLCLYT